MIPETLFDKLDSIGIEYTSQQKIFKKLAQFNFESIYVEKEKPSNQQTPLIMSETKILHSSRSSFNLVIHMV